MRVYEIFLLLKRQFFYFSWDLNSADEINQIRFGQDTKSFFNVWITRDDFAKSAFPTICFLIKTKDG